MNIAARIVRVSTAIAKQVNIGKCVSAPKVCLGHNRIGMSGFALHPAQQSLMDLHEDVWSTDQAVVDDLRSRVVEIQNGFDQKTIRDRCVCVWASLPTSSMGTLSQNGRCCSTSRPV